MSSTFLTVSHDPIVCEMKHKQWWCIKQLKNVEGINFMLNFLKKPQTEILKTELLF